MYIIDYHCISIWLYASRPSRHARTHCLPLPPQRPCISPGSATSAHPAQWRYTNPSQLLLLMPTSGFKRSPRSAARISATSSLDKKTLNISFMVMEGSHNVSMALDLENNEEAYQRTSLPCIRLASAQTFRTQTSYDAILGGGPIWFGQHQHDNLDAVYVCLCLCFWVVHSYTCFHHLLNEWLC